MSFIILFLVILSIVAIARFFLSASCELEKDDQRRRDRYD